VRRSGYLTGRRTWNLGEALVWGRDATATPRALVTTMLDSPPHRALLLSPVFADVGIGVVRGAPDGSGAAGALTVTLDFGRRA
jgi:uncharacterized protein YkwD